MSSIFDDIQRMRSSYTPTPKCSGCGKTTIPLMSTRYFLSPGAYIGGTPSQLIFCKTCMDRIRKDGPMFFTTYSFKQNDLTSNSNTDI